MSPHQENQFRQVQIKKSLKALNEEVLSGLHGFRAFEMYLRQPQSEPQSLK